MHVSRMATNRMLEERAAKDDAFRRLLERCGRSLLSYGQAMSDDALLAKLHSLGIQSDRQRLMDLFPRFISAEAMAQSLIDGVPIRLSEPEKNWVWIVVTCLWQRWRPNLPNTEMVEYEMQAGYAASNKCPPESACLHWLKAWYSILVIMARGGIDSLDAFDDCFGGADRISDWVQSLEEELFQAGLWQDYFWLERIKLCQTMINRFSAGRVPMDYFKTGLANSYFGLGDQATGERLFRDWLTERPQWGEGWVGWADCYWNLASDDQQQDATKAETILKQGLAVPDVEDRFSILAELKNLYLNTGRDKEAAVVLEEMKRLSALREIADSTNPRLSQTEWLVGRTPFMVAFSLFDNQLRRAHGRSQALPRDTPSVDQERGP